MGSFAPTFCVSLFAFAWQCQIFCPSLTLQIWIPQSKNKHWNHLYHEAICHLSKCNLVYATSSRIKISAMQLSTAVYFGCFTSWRDGRNYSSKLKMQGNNDNKHGQKQNKQLPNTILYLMLTNHHPLYPFCKCAAWEEWTKKGTLLEIFD